MRVRWRLASLRAVCRVLNSLIREETSVWADWTTRVGRLDKVAKVKADNAGRQPGDAYETDST